jgi:glycosyltransferase involved in cell wall biosynthesis
LRVLLALTYYRPHVSGLTIYGERLARGLAGRGHRVTVLTSRYHPRLPAREICDGVEIVRVPVALKVSKGVIMPLFPAYAATLVRRHDVINIHMPQFEAALLAGLGRMLGKPVLLTYDCDLKLPAGWLNRVVEKCLGPLNRTAARWSQGIVATAEDYARHSPFLSRYLDKLTAITPVIELPAIDDRITQRLQQRWKLRRPLIGFAARFAAEKGVEYLLQALPAILAEVPNVQIVFTGAYKDTVGEEAYWQGLLPLIDRHRERLIFLDLLADNEMPSFFALCDVLAVTSLNSTEAFAMVQAEAMLCGTPVVATDLPGVREVVRRTGMGEIVAPGDSAGLAQALVRVLKQRTQYVRPAAEIAAAFDPQHSIARYEALFSELAEKHRGSA